jgi:hypothetical protein
LSCFDIIGLLIRGSLPKDATIISDGIRSVTLHHDGETLDLAGWRLDKLALTPPWEFDGEIALQVRTTATEQDDGSTATIVREIEVRVLEGHACATPPGLNPFVSYLNPSAVISHSADTGRRTVRARGQGLRYLCARGIIPWA